MKKTLLYAALGFALAAAATPVLAATAPIDIGRSAMTAQQSNKMVAPSPGSLVATNIAVAAPNALRFGNTGALNHIGLLDTNGAAGQG